MAAVLTPAVQLLVTLCGFRNQCMGTYLSPSPPPNVWGAVMVRTGQEVI